MSLKAIDLLNSIPPSYLFLCIPTPSWELLLKSQISQSHEGIKEEPLVALISDSNIRDFYMQR